MRCLHLASALAAFGLLIGCGNGGGGDQPSIPPANEFGVCPMGDTGPKVSNLFGPATWEDPNDASSAACTYPPYNTTMCLSGVTLTTVDTYDETGEGAIGNFYVQDTAVDPNTLPPYSGVTVFAPTFSPPDLRVFPGDVLDVNGTAEEYPGPSTFIFDYCRTLPEVVGTMSFRFDGVTALAPRDVDVVDLHTYATARQWVGMLIRVQDVTLSPSSHDSSNRLTAKFPYILPSETVEQDPSVDNELYDIDTMGPDLSAGATFKSVTGILTYFGSFHLAPRSPADFEAE